MIKDKLTAYLKALADFLFPPICASCNTPNPSRYGSFCEECHRKFAATRLLPCRHCGKEMMHCICVSEELARTGMYRVAKVCPYYPDRRDSPELALLFAMKRKNVDAYRLFAAREMAASIRRMQPSLDGFTVTYVPRKPASVKEYGFDHAREISILVARELGTSWEETFYRTRDAREQKGLTRKERNKNATSTLLPCDGVSARGKRYIVCDDILTTGASLCACAKILTALGATEIIGAVFAARA